MIGLGLRRCCAVLGLVFALAAPLRADETIVKEAHATVTADGWKIALHRVRPATLIAGREPVVFFHGFLENHRYYDLDAKVSLAGYLAKKGFDCWTVDFRGAGDSDKPSLLALDGWKYSVDDYIHEDAPAAIDYVLGATGAGQVLCVGHSMGGLAIYGYLETESPAKVKGAVTLAGAGKMGLAASQRLSTILMLVPALAAEPAIPFDAPLPTGPLFKAATSSLLWPYFKVLLHGPLGAPVWQNKNMSDELIRAFLKTGVGNIGVNVAKQGLDWIRTEDVYAFGPGPHGPQKPTSAWFAVHGFWSYTAHLHDITTPMLVCTGADDQIVPSVFVKEVHDALASPDKTYRSFGTASGDSVDYGHEDIVVGVHSPEEVYPVVAGWLAAHGSK